MGGVIDGGRRAEERRWSAVLGRSAVVVGWVRVGDWRAACGVWRSCRRLPVAGTVVG